MDTELNTDRLTILSLGLGRDSVAMVCLLTEGKLLVEGEHLGPADVDVVVFSDTGAEWAHTYQVLPRVRTLCEEHGIRLLVLAKPPVEGELGWLTYLKTKKKGERSEPAWRQHFEGREATIEEKAAAGYYHRRAPVLWDYFRLGQITLRANAGCTSNHKIKPINSALTDDLCHERFGVRTANGAWGRLVKKGLRLRHRVLIGIAADEVHRAEKGAEAKARTANWFIEAHYPLVEAGITKADEGAILTRHDLNHVRKSGCTFCHFQTTGWFWALRETDPSAFEVVCEYEANANCIRDQRGEPHRWVRGDGRCKTVKPNLAAVVDRWAAAHPDADPQTVLDKEYSRGSCYAGTPSGNAA